MSLYTSDNKTVVETKSYLGDFRDVLAVGETITSQSVTVTVFSGDDTNPSHLLFQGITVHAGWIEQRIRLGIPGNIYSINFVVGTSLDNTYDKVTRLAILPEEENSVPQFTNLYETSTLYPYILLENITNHISITSGSMLPTPYMIEAVQNYINISGGTIVTYVPVNYLMSPEGITNNISLSSGTYVQYYNISYTLSPEAIKNAIAVISGTYTQYYAINYTTNPESIQNGISISGGTLGP